MSIKKKQTLLLIVISIFLGFTASSQCAADAGENTSTCLGGSVTLGGISSGNGALTYSWSPSTDLSCDDCPVPIASPTSTTTYTLTIEDADGCISSDNVQVTVNPLPDATFSFLPNNVCANIPVSFAANSIIGGNTYSWDFGNPTSGASNTAFSANTIHEFVSYGTTNEQFTVTLTVTDQNGCQAQTTEQVTINSLPQATLMDPIANFKNCDGTNYNMTIYDATPNLGTNYQIIWGDGSADFNSSTAPASGESHTYTTADIFDMYYIVTGTNTCIDTAHYVVSNITNPAIGAANPGATTGCGPITLCFPLSNYATNHPSTYYIIDYGDDSPIDTIEHVNLPPEICHTYTTTSCGRPGNAFTFEIQAENPCDISIASITPIRVYSAPVPDFSNPERACVNTGVAFTNSSVAGYNSSCQSTTLYQWDFGDGTVTPLSPIHSNPVHTYTTPGTYTVTLTVQNGCGTESLSNEICIEAVPVPDFALTPDTGCVPFVATAINNSDTTAICQYNINWEMINYSTTCSSTQNWSFANGTNASSWEPEFTFSSAGNYIVRLGMTNTCGTFYHNDTIEAQDVPQISLISPASICEGESTNPTVTVNGCYGAVTHYLWSFPSGTPISSTDSLPGSILYPNDGNYTVELEVANVCGSVNTSTPLVVNEPPVANAGLDVNFCSGENAQIGSPAEGGVTYQWNPPSDLSASNQSITTASPINGGNTPMQTEYVLTASTSPTCLSTDTVVVTVNPIPVVSVNSPTICVGESVQLEAMTTTSPMDFNWDTHTDLSCTNCADPSVAPTITTSYNVTASNQYGCDATIQSTVTVNPLPVVNAGTDQTVCDQPIPFNLIGTPAGGTWLGSPNVTIDGEFTPNGAEVAEIVYSYTDPVTNCENSDTVIITVEPPVTPVFEPTPEICINAEIVDLNTTFAPNPLGGTWSGIGVSGGSFNPATAGLGQHTLEYTYGIGTCQVISPVEIIVNAEPAIVSNNETICAGETVGLSVSGAGVGGTYTWTPSIGLSCDECETPDAIPITTTVYTITGTNAFGCSSSITATVTVNLLPTVSAGTDQLICNQPIPFDLVGTPAGGTWSGSSNITVGGTFTPNGSEVVELIYAYTNPVTGCENSDTVEITVSEPVVPTINPLDSLCINDLSVDMELFLNVIPTGGVFSGNGVNGTTFNPLTAGIGTHEIIYSYGSGTCLTSDTAIINVNSFPNVVAVGDLICIGETATISASSSDISTTFSWSPSAELSCDDCPNPTGNPISTTNYNVVGTNSFGCSNDAIATITVNPLPVVNAGNDTLLCNQAIGVQLEGTIAGGTWTGTGISPTGIFTPSESGAVVVTYTVVNAATGCQDSDDKTITVVDPVNAYAGIDLEECIDNNSTLVVGAPAGGTWSGTNVDAMGNFSIAADGIFELVYTYGEGNCLTKDTMQFTVHPLPIVDAGQDVELCISEPIISLTGTPLGGTFSGTGITDGNLGLFDPAIAGEGTFTITYAYTDPVTGCTNSDDLTAIVRPLPIVNFTVDPIVCQNATVPFTNTSTLINQSSWDFGDGGTSTDENPTYTYATSGTFDVQLIVTTQYACADSITQSIEVYVPPVVDFDVTPDSLCGPLTATFQNNSSGPDITYFWDFGNGTSSTDENPAPVMYPAGILADTSYTITLTVSNYCGQVSTQETITVMPQPVAVFGTDFDSFCSPWTPNIANTSYGLPDNYSWDFGNGTTSSTSDDLFQLPIYTTGADTTSYTIMLAVSNECGTDTAYHTIMALPNTVNSFFNTTTLEGCIELTVDFTQYTLGSTNYHWDFGDGNVSTTYSPSHTFTQAGTYDVSLMADNACSFDTTTVSIVVHPSPVLEYSYQPDSVCNFSPLQFTNESDFLANYHWDFGDGNTSTLTNPEHTYASSGDYIVTLSGTSADGYCSSTYSEVVHINAPPTSAFTLNPQVGCVPLDVQFTNQSVGGAYSYWDFGDGNTSTTTHPQHSYTTPGTYIVSLIVQGINGCSDTIAQYVNVNPIPTADFAYQPTGVICGPDVETQFTNLSTGAVGYQWSFGDGGTSTLVNPLYDYLTAGTFTIQLVASNQFGCTDTTTQQVTIHQTPEANFSLPSMLGCEDTYALFSSSSLYADSVVWDFGNGDVMTGTDVYYQYPDVGSYMISITTFGSGGCSDTFTATSFYDVQSSPDAHFNYETTTENITNATVIFTNESENYTSSWWDFGNGDYSTEDNPIYNYYEHNDFSVFLVVTNANGCTDTSQVWVKNPLLQDLYVPNAVYPGHSSFEVSHFLPKGIGLKEYHIQIYDDWGNLIWESSLLDDLGRPVEAWDATYKGAPVQQDAYIWKISAVFLDESIWEGKEYPKGKIKRSGTVTIIR